MAESSGERSENEQEGPPPAGGVGSCERPLTRPPRYNPPGRRRHSGRRTPSGERVTWRQLPLPGMPSEVPWGSTRL